MREIRARNGIDLTAPSTFPWWLAIAGYFSAISLGHLQFSLWLVQPRTTDFGAFAFKDLVPYVAIVSGLALATWLFRRARRSPRPKA